MVFVFPFRWTRVTEALGTRLRRVKRETASYADILWARHAIFLPHERLLKRMGTFLTLCSKISAGEHVKITEEPIGAWLLFSRKPIISCDRTTPKRVISFPTFPITYGKQIPNPWLRVWKKLQKNRRKQLFSMQFSVNPSGENKSVWQEFSGHRTLN